MINSFITIRQAKSVLFSVLPRHGGGVAPEHGLCCCVFGNESYIVPEKSVLRDFSLQNVKMSNRQTVLSQGLHLQEMFPEKEDLVINRIIPVL